MLLCKSSPRSRFNTAFRFATSSNQKKLITCITLCINAKNVGCPVILLVKIEFYLTYGYNYCIKIQWRIIPEI